MFFETMISTEDKSYYIDELEKRTGVSRVHWNRFSLSWLMRRFQAELLKGDRVHKKGGVNHD